VFTDASGGQVELPPLAVAYQSTNGLFVNAKEAVRQLFEQKRKEICSSPERADLKLSHEEALGWLLAHARGRRLLVEEARRIGKAAGEQATAVKKPSSTPCATRRSRSRRGGGGRALNAEAATSWLGGNAHARAATRCGADPGGGGGGALDRLTRRAR
jgi:hypothetical protein